MKKIIVVLFVIVFVSCSDVTGYKKKLNVKCSDYEPKELKIKEYNKALFGIDTSNFSEGLATLHDDFPELIPQHLDEGQIQYLQAFVTDTFCSRINRMTEETFPDITVVEDVVKSVYQHFSYYYPEVPVLPTYTYVSGVDMVSGPVMITPNYVIISLDYYLSNKDYIYDYIGMPRFMSVYCRPEGLPRDVGKALFNNYIGNNRYAKDILTEMVEKGKMYYFIEALAPSVNDSVLLGYTSNQLKWIEENEGDVWASVIGNKMLYSNNLDIRRTLFGEGPFSAAFADDAPPRLGEYIGLQIVRSFMSANDIALTDLMNMTDEQDIFQRSQYKPAKR